MSASGSPARRRSPKPPRSRRSYRNLPRVVRKVDPVLTKTSQPREKLRPMAASNRRILMAALLAGIAALAALNGAEGQAQSSPALRPNVVMIMTDDQTLESMRVMPNVKTLLADQGVTFDNNFVSYSLCCPSRATYLTGQYAHNHGVWGNAAPNGGYYKLDSTNTLPVWLQPRRLPDDAHRQVPQRLRHAERARGAAGLGPLVRLRRPDDVPLLQLHAQRERDDRQLRHGCRRTTRPTSTPERPSA